jgi:hypothetical protein
VADTFNFAGAITTTPLGLTNSFVASLNVPIQEQFTLDAKTSGEVQLTSDSALPLNFGGVTDANIVTLKVLPGASPVTAALTWAGGTSQVVPVDTYTVLMSEGKPITAITLQRTPGVLSTVEYLLGQSV